MERPYEETAREQVREAEPEQVKSPVVKSRREPNKLYEGKLRGKIYKAVDDEDGKRVIFGTSDNAMVQREFEYLDKHPEMYSVIYGEKIKHLKEDFSTTQVQGTRVQAYAEKPSLERQVSSTEITTREKISDSLAECVNEKCNYDIKKAELERETSMIYCPRCGTEQAQKTLEQKVNEREVSPGEVAKETLSYGFSQSQEPSLL